MKNIRQLADNGSSRRRVTSAASWAREEMSSLAKMCARWVWTVRLEMYMRVPIWGLDSPSATSAATEYSVGVRLGQPNRGRLRAPRRAPAMMNRWRSSFPSTPPTGRPAGSG